MNAQVRESKAVRKAKPASLLEIFFTFLRVGAFTIGGGLAMLPLFEREVIDNKGWIEREELLDIYAISQSIPGVIAGNSSTFIGYRIAGFPGALSALAGVLTPSIVVILVIATSFTQFRETFYVAKALQGARTAVAALIILAAVRISRASLKNTFAVVLAALSFLVACFTNIDMIYAILAGGLLGVLAGKIAVGGMRQ
ncbi:MAG: chromate transporter [Firmicutes bacterium]|nr:chromate transporter [Bacillota bacterium]